jgi:hypothetical protein
VRGRLAPRLLRVCGCPVRSPILRCAAEHPGVDGTPRRSRVFRPLRGARRAGGGPHPQRRFATSAVAYAGNHVPAAGPPLHVPSLAPGVLTQSRASSPVAPDVATRGV